MRRLAVGAPVTVRDGAGTAASGTLVRMSKQHLELSIERPHCPPPLAPVHLLVPVADKERMLLLAEKATELGVTTWRPVLWRRSRSVAGRGEGPMFAQKVEARMIGALLQSEGAWLPQRFTESNAERAIAALPAEGTRLLLDPTGVPLAGVPLAGPVTIAVGPEGGFEVDEVERLVATGFQRVALAGGILRMETAAIVALGVVRTLLALPEPRADNA
ncbi:MAG: RsmE family RNA methyltransferase [Gemmatimonadaceae bacterium]|nr:RsmE family RNA methyltransferase [Gemmatimonadaceae bacterium]